MNLRGTQEQAYSFATRKNISRHILVFLTFCMHFKFNPLPATPYCLAMFAVYLSKRVGSVATIANYISSVMFLHKMCDFPLPDRKHFEFRLAMEGLKRKLKRRVRKAAPVTPEILLSIREKLNLHDPLDATMWALFLVCFHILLRASNVTPKTHDKFDNTRQLTRGDIILGKRIALVDIKWTKTVQAYFSQIWAIFSLFWVILGEFLACFESI